MGQHPDQRARSVADDGGMTCGYGDPPHATPCVGGHGWARLVAAEPALLVLGGCLDSTTVVRLREGVSTAQAAGSCGSVAMVDLMQVASADTPALVWLLAGLAAARQIDGGTLLVIGPAAREVRILRSAGLAVDSVDTVK